MDIVLKLNLVNEVGSSIEQKSRTWIQIVTAQNNRQKRKYRRDIMVIMQVTIIVMSIRHFFLERCMLSRQHSNKNEWQLPIRLHPREFSFILDQHRTDVVILSTRAALFYNACISLAPTRTGAVVSSVQPAVEGYTRASARCIMQCTFEIMSSNPCRISCNTKACHVRRRALACPSNRAAFHAAPTALLDLRVAPFSTRQTPLFA